MPWRRLFAAFATRCFALLICASAALLGGVWVFGGELGCVTHDPCFRPDYGTFVKEIADEGGRGRWEIWALLRFRGHGFVEVRLRPEDSDEAETLLRLDSKDEVVPENCAFTATAEGLRAQSATNNIVLDDQTIRDLRAEPLCLTDGVASPIPAIDPFAIWGRILMAVVIALLLWWGLRVRKKALLLAAHTKKPDASGVAAILDLRRSRR